MPIFHATLFFSQPPRWGWVEQFWWQGPDLSSAFAAAKQLALSRYSILGAGVSCYQVRVSVPGVPRAGLAAPITGKALPYPAMPGVQALEVRLTGKGVRFARRSFKIGGLPAAGVLADASGADFASWLTTAGSAWLNQLLAGGWRLHVEAPVGPQVPIAGLAEVALDGGDPFGAPVDAAEADPATTLIYCQMSAPPVGPAATVRLWGARMAPKVRSVQRAVNGTHDLFAADGQGVYWPGTFGSGSYVGGGTVQLYRPGVVPIVAWDTVRLTGRKVGPAKTSVPEQVPLPATPLLATGPTGPGSVFKPLVAPPIPGTNTYQTMIDMMIEVFDGYIQEPAPQAPLIGLAQVADSDHARYVLFLAGIDNTISQATTQQWANGLLALVAAPDTYTSYVRDIIRENTPDGCELIVCGHSLGGIVAQSLEGTRANLGQRRVTLKVGCGCPSLSYTLPSLLLFQSPEGDVYSPITGPPLSPTRLFAVRLDPVPYFSPAGDWLWLRLLTLMANIPDLEFVIFLEGLFAPQNIKIISAPNLLPDNPITRHNCYNRAPDLATYSWDGVYDPSQSRPALKTGPVKRFPYPPNP